MDMAGFFLLQSKVYQSADKRLNRKYFSIRNCWVRISSRTRGFLNYLQIQRKCEYQVLDVIGQPIWNGGASNLHNNYKQPNLNMIEHHSLDPCRILNCSCTHERYNPK